MSFLTAPTLHPGNLARSIEAGVPVKFLRDIKNRLIYGAAGPLSDEPLFINPKHITRRYIPDRKRKAPVFRRRHSGLVQGGDWDLSWEPHEKGFKYIACMAHWKDGQSWEETGIYDRHLKRIAQKGVSDECTTLEDVKRRYDRLDKVFEQVRREGRFRLYSERDDFFRREHGGVMMHIDRDGMPLRHGGGAHRLAMAHALDLPEMPVQPGVIHLGTVRGGHMARLRRSIHA